MAMISMKLTQEEAKAETMLGEAQEDKGPAYPYGLSLNLDDEVLRKLGIASLPSVGTKLQLSAVVEVTSNSQYENQTGKENCMNLQITDMSLSGEGEQKDQASMLYGD